MAIADEKQLARALASFEAFRAHVPPTITEECVSEYHAIVDAIGDASGERQLDVLKIADSELERKVIGSQRISFSGRGGRVVYSKERRCDSHRFQRQIAALAGYLESQGHVCRPQQIHQSKPQHHSVHVENMYGSAIQQGTRDSNITINVDVKSAQFRDLVSKVKEAIPRLDVDADTKNELYAAVGTVEVQIGRSNPSHSIIGESMSTVRSILEGIAANLLTGGLLAGINHYFPR